MVTHSHQIGLRWMGLLLLVLGSAALSSCGSVSAPARWTYQYQPGRTAIIGADGRALAPPSAPMVVRRAIGAANEIAGKPYKWGGGHARLVDSGYDCSGATSYVLNRTGLMRGSGTSDGFRRFGSAGAGEWVTMYAKDGHVFLVIAGLRFDTGGRSNRDTGPQWKTSSRPTSGFQLRHPPGL